MKNILVLLDGSVAKKLLDRMIDVNVKSNSYDIVYIDDTIVPKKIPFNFLFYKFDFTSLSKLLLVLNKNIHSEVLVALSNKTDTLAAIENIRFYSKILQISVLNNWDIDFNDPYITNYNGLEVLANGLLEKLPNIPVIAQNIGLREGEIIELRIPFGSSYAYRSIGSIEQKNWRIFGLYRNNKLILTKKNMILKPNDTILLIGKPEVLIEVYKSITIPKGQFPMPFGSNIYLLIDCILQSPKKILLDIDKVILINRIFQNKNCFIRIINPTNTKILQDIYNKIKNIKNIFLYVDFYNKDIQSLVEEDINNFDVGLIIFSYKIFKQKNKIKNFYNFKLPILKLAKEDISDIKSISVLLNDISSYEQISPTIFDIATQFRVRIDIFDYNPISDESKIELEQHYVNLGKIFNKQLSIKKGDKNPIRELIKQKNTLQLLPLKKDMFKRKFLKFFIIDSDILSYDINKFNQLFIPIIDID